MNVLLDEYRASLQSLKELRDQAPEEDKKILGNMVSSLEFAVKWLKNGRMPEPKQSGMVPSEAHLNFEETFGLVVGDPYSRGAFEEVENRIDAERRRKRRA